MSQARVARKVGLGAVLAALLLFAWAYQIQMPGRVYAGPRQSLSREGEEIRQHLLTHVRVLAGEIGERNYVKHAALGRAADYIDTVLTALGYRVATQEYTARRLTFRNLEATLPGRGRADEIIVVGGHYDSVDGAPGADDNASGTAAVLELARLLARDRFERTVRFVAFVNEEPPFFNRDSMGSRVYAARVARDGQRVVAMLSLESIGFYSTGSGSQRYPFPFSLFYPDRGDFVGFVANLASRPLVRRSVRAFRQRTPLPSQGVAAPGWMPGIFWSDHASFWRHGYQAIMITDTAPFRNWHYHQETDTPDKLDYARMAHVVEGVADVVRELARPAS